MTQVSPEAYNNIIRNFPGRQDQIDLLLRLFRRPQDPVPCLFLYGATGSGKTLLMREVMKLIGARHCLVNSLECYSQRLLFESALNQLDQEGILKNKTCAELSRFVALLDQLLTKEMNTSYLIFDKAERLRGEFQFIVNALLRLNEQTDRNVCVIFLSRVSFDEFRDDSGSPEPISIHFPSYNRDQIQELILLDSNSIFNQAASILNLPEELAQHLENLLHNFVSLVLDVFFNACADLSELHHIVELLFPKYLQPIVTDGVKPNEILILYNRIRPFLQDVLKSLSLREISFSDLIKKSQDDPNAKKNVIDLPLSAKYILIASYLASYNNPKYDKQIFGTSHVGKAKKTRRIKNAKEKLQQQFEGPKAFQLNRMLAIYTSIAKGDEDQQDTITSQYVSPTTVQIFTQISSLVGLKLLALDSTSSFNLDKAKYKCCVDLDYIETIANSINFKLYNFLYNE